MDGQLGDSLHRRAGELNLRSFSGRWRLWLLGPMAAVVVAVMIGLHRNEHNGDNQSVAMPAGVGDDAALHQAALPLALPGRVSTSRAHVEARLARLDRASAAVAEKHLQRISAFLSERKRSASAFAEEAYSWTGKFHLVKGKLLSDDGTEFRSWLQRKFEEKVFKGEELQALVESVIDGYAAEMQGLESDALVEIRADIAQDDLFQGKVPVFQTDTAFQAEYRRLTADLVPAVVSDLKIGAAGFATNFVLSEVASRTLGPVLSSGLGLTGTGVLSGLAQSGITVGVGIVAWWALDKIIDWLLDLFGYGPVADLAARVEQGLGRIESRLIDGEPPPGLEAPPLLLPEWPAPVAPMGSEPPPPLLPPGVLPFAPSGIQPPPLLPPGVLPFAPSGLEPPPLLLPAAPVDTAPVFPPVLEAPLPSAPLGTAPLCPQAPPPAAPVELPPLHGVDWSAVMQPSPAIGQGGVPGLRHEFQKFHEIQSRLRRAAILRLVNQG